MLSFGFFFLFGPFYAALPIHVSNDLHASAAMALFQRTTPANRLGPVLAANGSVLVVALPLGTVLGGPLVTAMGARGTLLVSAVATVVLDVCAAGLLATRNLKAT